MHRTAARRAQSGARPQRDRHAAARSKNAQVSARHVDGERFGHAGRRACSTWDVARRSSAISRGCSTCFGRRARRSPTPSSFAAAPNAARRARGPVERSGACRHAAERRRACEARRAISLLEAVVADRDRRNDVGRRARGRGRRHAHGGARAARDRGRGAGDVAAASSWI